MRAHIDRIYEDDCKMLSDNFNRKKLPLHYSTPHTQRVKELQNLGKQQCLGKNDWSVFEKVQAWMISAETAVFMKMGGLGMIASELPEAYNRVYHSGGDEIQVVTPLYVGNTGKKKALWDADNLVYSGAEGKSLNLMKKAVIEVPFCNKEGKLIHYRVNVYQCRFEGVDYILLENNRFFSINPHADNPSAQDGCYVFNENGINEVERFAFFTKAVYVLLKDVYENSRNPLKKPNLMIANDWHSGELAGLLKYFTLAQEEVGFLDEKLADKLQKIPVVHIAHHLGYQGWDYENSQRLLNSLYEYTANLVFKNAKAIKNSNPRTSNTLIVYDSYNQASCNLHLADRVVTVSKNYMEEVSKFLDFGWDFRDILKIRKDHRTFLGIVNGYDKNKISPNAKKIKAINDFFGMTDFVVYDENSLEKKNHNKAEFLKLLSMCIKNQKFKQDMLPLIDFYKFDDIWDDIVDVSRTPIFCATSRMVEQKGYDIAANAILNLTKKYQNAVKNCEIPVFIMGGAGDVKYFRFLKKLKDDAMKIDPRMGKRIFVFRGYKDEFAYAIQLASDFYMMPCRFEPCGLTQMEAMAKGTLPVAMSTGGLVDTIVDGVDGFRTDVFFVNKTRVYGSNLIASRLKNNVNAYAETVEKSLETFYNNPQQIEFMKIKAMQKDFSWEQGGILAEYYNLFHYGIG